MSENAILMIERFFRSRWIVDRYRNERSKLAEARVGCVCDDPTKIVIGLGGGMLGRSHPALINLNIKQFDDVDLVADAHRIPLRDQSVDGVHCGAVFEHFQDPQEAAAELFRVMKPGALYQGTMLPTRNINYGKGRAVAPGTFVVDGSERGHPHFYCDPATLVALFAGFELLSVKQQLQRKPGSWHWHVIAERPPQ